MLLITLLPFAWSQSAEEPAAQSETSRSYNMESAVRVRRMKLPDSILDIWFHDEESDNGLHQPRPKVTALSVGLEYVLQQDTQNGIFYFDYAHSLMDEGYWDDIDDPDTYTDGDYLRPEGLGLATIGADYAFGLPFNPGDPNCEVSLMVGGGLGLTFVVGEIYTWDSALDSSGNRIAAWERMQSEPEPEPDDVLDMPRVLPMVDLNLGLRFVIAESAVLRLEGGLHDLVYFGGSLGMRF